MARRKALQASVAALCVEVGFVAAGKDSMGVLSEILQSCEYVLACFILNEAHHNNPLIRYNRTGKDFSPVQ